MTERQVPCVGCLKGQPIITKGYLPLYRMIDAKPVMVIVSEDVTPELEKFPLHQPVTLGRETGPGNAVWVTKSLVKTKYETTLAERRIAASVSLSCLTVWNIDELKAWFFAREKAEQQGKPVTTHCHSDPDTERERAERDAPPELVSRAKQARVMRTNPAEAIGMGEVINGTLNGVHVNGKPKPR